MEEVKDEDKKRMNKNENARGSSIIEDVEDINKKDEREETKPNEGGRIETQRNIENRGGGGDMSNTGAATKLLQ